MEESDAEESELDPLVTKDCFISDLDQSQRREESQIKRKAESKVSFDIKKNGELPPVQKNKKERLISNEIHHHTYKQEDSFLPVLSEVNEGPCMEEVHLPLRKKLNGTTEESSAVIGPFFGVKNYLHYFYERPDMKNAIYLMDDNEEAFLVKQREGACNTQVFRLSLFLGGIILLVGAIALIVAMYTTRRIVLEGKMGGIAMVDKVAAAYNSEMDALLLVSLVAVVIGATIVAAALISRTFCSQQEYDEAFR